MNFSSFLGNGVNILAVTAFVAFWAVIIAKFIKNKFSSVKTVNAVVADKYKTQGVSKIYGALKRERYIVIFNIGGKKLAFAVSGFSYESYKIGEKGVLTYKGITLIDFS